jgi:arabinan endo-1,5-alpha-L-arabinosidase
MGGRSVLAVRPLLWKNGWPYAGERFRGGTFAIESERRGYSLEMAVDFVRMQQERQRWNNRNQMQQPPKPVPNQKLEDVISTWPAADVPVGVRCSDYMFRPHQLWTITPVEEAGGYLSAPYFKITIAGTERALTATADKELATVAYHGGAEQLWRIEQLTDGTYRIMPKEIPGMEGTNTRYCLYSAADSTPTLAVYDFSSDNSKWNIRNH